MTAPTLLPAGTLIRTFEPELQIRTAAQGGDGRTVVGLAVPYGRPQRIDDELVEQFAPGAFADQLGAAHRVKFARDHLSRGGTLIGRAVELREDPAGLVGEFRVSATPTGDETLELIRDGALTHLSIGFRERQNRRLPGGITERVTAALAEVAVVLQGAYGELAAVSDVRSAEEPAPPLVLERLARARQITASLPLL